LKQLLVASFVLAVSTAAVHASGAISPNGAFTPPPCTAAPFVDVPSTHPFCSWIKQLYEDGITGGCGGGNYCPDAPVTRAQMSVFLETAMRGTPTWDPKNAMYTRTIIVSPIDGGTELQNGEVLRAAVAEAATWAASGSVLVKLEPGKFDLGDQPLTIPIHVMVEGAGPSQSVVYGTPATPSDFVLTLSAVTSLRDLQVNAVSGGVALSVVGNTVLDHVDVNGNPAIRCSQFVGSVQLNDSTVSGTRTAPEVIALDLGCGADLHNVEVHASGNGRTSVTAIRSQAGLNATDLKVQIQKNATATTYLQLGASAWIDQFVFESWDYDLTGTVTVIEQSNGNLELRNGKVAYLFGDTVTGVKSVAMDVPEFLTLSDVILEVQGVTSAEALRLGTGNSEIRNSRIVARANTSKGLTTEDSAIVRVANSHIWAQQAISNNGMRILVGASELNGTVNSTGLALTKCVHSWNDSFDALNSDCSVPVE
jgi:hypothetical protein